jgi:hypothetical protein
MRHLREVAILLIDGMPQTEGLPDWIYLQRWLLRWNRPQGHLRLARHQLGAGPVSRAA